MFGGKRYLSRVIECDGAPSIIETRRNASSVASGTDNKKAQAVVEEWYREQIREAVPPLIAKWEPVMGVKVVRFLCGI